MKKNFIAIAVCSVFAVLTVLITIDTATSGMEIGKLQKDEAQLLEEKSRLEEALIKGESMASLSQKSAEMGFVKPQDTVYITSVEPVAKLP